MKPWTWLSTAELKALMADILAEYDRRKREDPEAIVRGFREAFAQPTLPLEPGHVTGPASPYQLCRTANCLAIRQSGSVYCSGHQVGHDEGD